MIFDNDLSGLRCRKDGTLLSLSITEHCLAKNKKQKKKKNNNNNDNNNNNNLVFFLNW